MATPGKLKSTRRVLEYLRGEPPARPSAPSGPVPPPLPEMEGDEDADLALLPLTRPAKRSRMFRAENDAPPKDDDSTDEPADVNAEY